MSRLNDMYQSAKRHAGKIVAGAVIVGALAGVRGCVNSIGEEVYRGNINDQEVLYEEGVQAILDGNEDNFVKNRMVVRNGDMTYIFEDRAGETSIDWRNQQKPDFEKDNLEKVIIQNGDISQTYISKFNDEKNSIDTSTIQGQKAQEIFDKANPLYNNLRTKIREDLRNNYDARQKLFVDSFPE